MAKVKKRKRDAKNLPVREANSNHILDACIYELEFPDGWNEEYYVNIIAEKLFNMASADGWDIGLLEEIEDLISDKSISFPRYRGSTQNLVIF